MLYLSILLAIAAYSGFFYVLKRRQYDGLAVWLLLLVATALASIGTVLRNTLPLMLGLAVMVPSWWLLITRILRRGRERLAEQRGNKKA
jgi:hypothetical protein